MDNPKKYNLETVTCDLCGNIKFKTLYKKQDMRFTTSEEEFKIVQCANCGLCFVNPRPTYETIQVFYPQEYYFGRKEGESNIIQNRFKKEAGYLKNLKKGRLLDVGCAGGGFLETMQRRGWEVYGMDISGPSTPEGNFDIKHGELHELKYPSDFFDVVTA